MTLLILCKLKDRLVTKRFRTPDRETKERWHVHACQHLSRVEGTTRSFSPLRGSLAKPKSAIAKLEQRQRKMRSDWHASGHFPDRTQPNSVSRGQDSLFTLRVPNTAKVAQAMNHLSHSNAIKERSKILILIGTSLH